MTGTQGTFLDHLVLEAREICVPGSHATVIIRETTPGRLPHLGSCTDSRLKYTPSLSMKDPLLLVLELQPLRQVSGLAYIYKATAEEIREHKNGKLGTELDDFSKIEL